MKDKRIELFIQMYAPFKAVQSGVSWLMKKDQLVVDVC